MIESNVNKIKVKKKLQERIFNWFSFSLLSYLVFNSKKSRIIDRIQYQELCLHLNSIYVNIRTIWEHFSQLMIINSSISFQAQNWLASPLLVSSVILAEYLPHFVCFLLHWLGPVIDFQQQTIKPACVHAKHLIANIQEALRRIGNK